MIYKSLLRHKLVCDGNEYPPSGVVVRVPSSVEFEQGNPVEHLKKSEISNLPPEKDGIIYIVPKIVAVLCNERKDLVSPVGVIKNKDMSKQYCQYLARVTVD